MDLIPEQEDIKKIDAILRIKNDYIDEVLYDEFSVCADSSSERISDEDEVDGYNYEIPELIDIKNFYKYDALASLRSEEKLVIDSCHDPDLKKLLVLNRTRRVHLIKLYKKMKDVLIECKQNIIEKCEVVKAGKSLNLQHVYSKCWRLAAPYFKDKQYFLSPPNADTLRKKADNEMSAYDFVMSPKWSRAECDKLIASVTFNYNLNRQMAIKMQISVLSRNGTINEECEQIRQLQKQLEYFKCNEHELPPLNTDEYIDWHRVSGKFLKDKYSVFECRSFWHTYLHPKVNKDSWSLREDSKLKELVAKYGFRNWTKIAESLGTKRSCLQVCMHYFRYLHRHIKVGTFTVEEDDLLLSLIEKYRMGNHIPWAKIVKHFKNRKRTQIYQRYVNYLCRDDRKRGKFSQAEDAMIMICVDKYGLNYQKFVKHLPLRSAVQIKMRYRNNCQVLLKRGEYSVHEDMRIMEHVEKYGTKNWGPLANELTRSTGLLRQRYMTIASFLNRHHDKMIKDVQRRKTKTDRADMERYQLARSIADTYKDQSIPTLEQLEEHILYLHSLETISSNMLSDEDVYRTKPCVDTEEQRIDWKLVEFFTYSSLENEQDPCEEKSHNLSSTMREVETTLRSLQSKLNIESFFTKSRYLDPTDFNILSEYKKHLKNLEQSGFIGLSTKKLVPPNFNTCLAFKCLLINHAKHKRCIRTKMNLNDRLDTNISKDKSIYLKKNRESQRKTISQINIFYHGFYRLFKWPSMLSSMHPTSGLLYSSQHMPMQRIAKRSDKHYSKQYQTADFVSSTHHPKIYSDQMSEINCLEYSINPAGGSTSDKNCTDTYENDYISGNNSGAQHSQLSIRIIRSATKGTEVIQVFPNTWEGGSNHLQPEARENKKIRTELTVNSAVKQYSRKTRTSNEKKNYHSFQPKNECVANCRGKEYMQNSQKRLERTFHLENTTFGQHSQNISALSSRNSNFKAQLPFSFVNIKCESADTDGDIKFSQTTNSISIRVKTESMYGSIDEPCSEKCPEILNKIYPSMSDSTEGPHSIRRYFNNENDVKPTICEGLSKLSNSRCTKSIIGPLKLAPVTNKSVINDLLTDKSKKFFVSNNSAKKGLEGTYIKKIELNRTKCEMLVAPKISHLQNSSDRLSVSIESMDNAISITEIEDNEVTDCKIETSEHSQRDEKGK